MTSTSRFNGLAATQTGRTAQLTRAYKTMAADMKRRQSAQPVDIDEPQTLADALRLITALRQQLADAQAAIDDMRKASNGEVTVSESATADYWTTAQVARKSNVAICTICRNAGTLGGRKVGSDWFFPVGTTYGRRRKSG